MQLHVSEVLSLLCLFVFAYHYVNIDGSKKKRGGVKNSIFSLQMGKKCLYESICVIDIMNLLLWPLV